MDDLIADMKNWRADRPDEWKMDEFIREVEKLKAENKELRELLDDAEGMMSLNFATYKGTPVRLLLTRINNKLEENSDERL
jgi:hypothetical protein